MSAIAKKLVGFLFNGATQALASASWKPNVNAIYGFNAAGDGYQVFKPTSNFNSLTQLKQDGSYIVDAKTPGFELPGATLTASAAPSGAVPTLTLQKLQHGVDPVTLLYVFNLQVSSTVASDTACKVAVVATSTSATDNGALACANYENVPIGSEFKQRDYAIPNSGNVDGDTRCWLFVTAPSGATLFHEYFYNDANFWT